MECASLLGPGLERLFSFPSPSLRVELVDTLSNLVACCTCCVCCGPLSLSITVLHRKSMWNCARSMILTHHASAADVWAGTSWGEIPVGSTVVLPPAALLLSLVGSVRAHRPPPHPRLAFLVLLSWNNAHMHRHPIIPEHAHKADPIIGSWLKGRDRSKVILCTKVRHSTATHRTPPPSITCLTRSDVLFLLCLMLLKLPILCCGFCVRLCILRIIQYAWTGGRAPHEDDVAPEGRHLPEADPRPHHGERAR